MKKYTEKERPMTYAKCFDCGLDYTLFSCDMIIQNYLWEVISPSYNKGCGLLCPDCICKRLMELGLTCVQVTVDVSELLNDKRT